MCVSRACICRVGQLLSKLTVDSIFMGIVWGCLINIAGTKLMNYSAVLVLDLLSLSPPLLATIRFL